MHLIGCLFFTLFFILIFGLALVGSVIDGISRLLFGSSRRRQRPADEQEPRRQNHARSAEEPASYTFRPEDGEYIDYEEVRE